MRIERLYDAIESVRRRSRRRPGAEGAHASLKAIRDQAQADVERAVMESFGTDEILQSQYFRSNCKKA